VISIAAAPAGWPLIAGQRPDPFPGSGPAPGEAAAYAINYVT